MSLHSYTLHHTVLVNRSMVLFQPLTRVFTWFLESSSGPVLGVLMGVVFFDSLDCSGVLFFWSYKCVFVPVSLLYVYDLRRHDRFWLMNLRL